MGAKMPFSRLIFSGVAFLLLIASEQSAARDPSGTAVAVVQATEVAGDLGLQPLQTLDAVYMGDRIATESTGEAQIIFRDQTKLVVGPTSVVVVDSFVFNDDNSASSVGMSAAKGVFRFITGVSQKQAYSIKTPSATIGVRGTAFDMYLAPTGETAIAMFDGSARVCNRLDVCLELLAGCSILIIDEDGRFTRLRTLEERTRWLNTGFPYVFSQISLQPDFRIDVSACMIRWASIDTELTTPPSASPH
jgi:hypothetical protein